MMFKKFNIKKEREGGVTVQLYPDHKLKFYTQHYQDIYNYLKDYGIEFNLWWDLSFSFYTESLEDLNKKLETTKNAVKMIEEREKALTEKQNELEEFARERIQELFEFDEMEENEE